LIDLSCSVSESLARRLILCCPLRPMARCSLFVAHDCQFGDQRLPALRPNRRARRVFCGRRHDRVTATLWQENCLVGRRLPSPARRWLFCTQRARRPWRHGLAAARSAEEAGSASWRSIIPRYGASTGVRAKRLRRRGAPGRAFDWLRAAAPGSKICFFGESLCTVYPPISLCARPGRFAPACCSIRPRLGRRLFDCARRRSPSLADALPFDFRGADRRDRVPLMNPPLPAYT